MYYWIVINRTINTAYSVLRTVLIVKALLLKTNSTMAISFKVVDRFRNHQVNQMKLKMCLLELRNN